jgi:hypothetical protein
MTGQNVEVLTEKLNLSHMELPNGSGVSFQVFCKHFPRMFASLYIQRNGHR